MPTDTPLSASKRCPSVFLSYASEDRIAAQAIRDALPALGLVAWYDESALDGGDAWDRKIRRQIRECDFFMPLISAQTQARSEGYFRREWRLAVERTLDMADDHVFLLPIVIDDTREAEARVPDRFLAVQWMWLAGGQPTPEFEALCRRLASGQTSVFQARNRDRGPAAARGPIASRGPDSAESPSGAEGRTIAGASSARTIAARYPPFPQQDPGRRAQFFGRVALWATQAGWLSFMRLPRWMRYVACVWLFIMMIRGCHPADPHPETVSPAQASKLKEIANNFRSAGGDPDVAALAAAIAKTFPSQTSYPASSHNPLLAVPFSAPSGDALAQKLADSTFAQVYGRIAISHRGQVGLPTHPLPPGDLSAALEGGRAQHASYLLYGEIDQQPSSQSLTVKLIDVSDGSVSWSASYPVAGADSARIAAEVDSKIPSLDDD